MNKLIIYAGKTGCTEKCAKILEQRLSNATVIDITKEKVDISAYDLIIIGSSIRVGKIHKEVKKFINDNQGVLKDKKTAYYICCGFSKNYKQYFEDNIPKELLNAAIVYDTFGGELDITKQKGIDKLIIRIVSKTEEGKKEIKILTGNIDRFIDKLGG